MTHKLDLTDYTKVRNHCEKTSQITVRVIDDFLIAFAARHHNQEKKMNQHFAKYRHIVSKFQRRDIELFKSQFIIHEVFKSGGLIEKFLKNPALDRFTGEEREFLLQQAAIPWRFSFAEIIEEPEKEFYRMRDTFSGEKYLLFSPSITQMKTTSNKLLWFNLICFNGLCWQSFGPIGAFQSFGPADIFFFANEKNSDIEDESEVQKDIETDPLPYMMLLSGAAYPRTFHKNDEIIIMMAEHESDTPDTAGMKKYFQSEYDSGVYRFTHKTLGEHPHFAQIYYDENERLLLFSAMTGSGFRNLVKDFNSFGYNIPETPYLQVRLPMVITAGSILNRKIILNEYEGLFKKDPDPQAEAAIEKMNEFMALVLDDINEDREPDIEAAIRKTGLDPETAHDLVNMVQEKRGTIKKRSPGQKTKKQEIKQPPKRGEERQTSNPFTTIYQAAGRISETEPWKNLYETDIFGIKMPDSDRVYFISVMGINGEFTGLAAYKGYEGLSGFYALQKNAELSSATAILQIPHLLISFTDREDMDNENIAAIKKSGLTFRGKGKWPLLEEVVPGFVPAFPEGETLEDLPVLLSEAASVLSWAGNDPDSLYGEGDDDEEILIRIPSGKPGNLKWKNHFEVPGKEKMGRKYNMTYNAKTVESVKKLKVSKLTFQTDLVLVPTPVKEKEKKGYFPFMLLLVEKKSGMIAGMELLSPDPDLPSLYESAPQKLLELIIKLGHRPEKIEFRSDLLHNLAGKVLKLSGCTPVLVDRMPQMEEAEKSILEFSGKKA